MTIISVFLITISFPRPFTLHAFWLHSYIHHRFIYVTRSSHSATASIACFSIPLCSLTLITIFIFDFSFIFIFHFNFHSCSLFFELRFFFRWRFMQGFWPGRSNIFCIRIGYVQKRGFQLPRKIRIL